MSDKNKKASHVMKTVLAVSPKDVLSEGFQLDSYKAGFKAGLELTIDLVRAELNSRKED